MGFDRIDGKTDRLHIALVPFRAQAGNFAQLRRADGREVLGMAEEQTPAISEPFVKANAALRAVLLEIGGNLPKLTRHGNSFVRLASYGRVETTKQMKDRKRKRLNSSP